MRVADASAALDAQRAVLEGPFGHPDIRAILPVGLEDAHVAICEVIVCHLDADGADRRLDVEAVHLRPVDVGVAVGIEKRVLEVGGLSGEVVDECEKVGPERLHGNAGGEEHDREDDGKRDPGSGPEALGLLGLRLIRHLRTKVLGGVCLLKRGAFLIGVGTCLVGAGDRLVFRGALPVGCLWQGLLGALLTAGLCLRLLERLCHFSFGCVLTLSLVVTR